jgi:hypothetical protein
MDSEMSMKRNTHSTVFPSRYYHDCTLLLHNKTYFEIGTDHLTWKEGGVWFFVSFRIFYSDNTRVRIFFYQNLTLGYVTKILNQIIFLFLHQNQNICFSNIGNQNIFLEKKT